jgi:transcriptional regulator with GAF, ATPase, and Fis domain
MNLDQNVFFRDVTLRLCSSLDIGTALQRCFEYIQRFIPLTRLSLHIFDPDLNVLRFVASAGAELPEGSEHVIPLPEKGRSERAILSRNRQVVQVLNEADPKLGLREIQERLGLKPEISAMSMALELEGNRIGSLGLVADGFNRYTDQHASLLRLLHEPFAIAMSNALKHQEVIRLKDMLADDNRYLFDELRSVSGNEIIGADFGLERVMEMVRRVAPLDSPVLLLGETGTGKEVVANAIHYSSPRKDEPFIKVNCGAIPETLLDTELFGHEKGAFTGAMHQKRGRFERADRGTIFLDEIGELPLQAQVRLLHVLQRKEIERVGGTAPVPIDTRIISATNRNLGGLIASGRFREDLWFRLNVFPITIPPLRQRREDIPALVHHFIERKSMELKLTEEPRLAPGAIDRLIDYEWPGNVRELENMIERALIQHRGNLLSFEHLLPERVLGGHDLSGPPGQNQALPSLNELTAGHIRHGMNLAQGKINGPGGAAQILGVHPNTLRKRMNKLGIPYGRKSWRPLNTAYEKSGA